MSTRGFAWLLVILIVPSVLALIGGGYYYLGVYQPKEYTKQVSKFYDALRSDEQNLGSIRSGVKSNNDYRSAISSLDVIDQFLSDQEAKLNNIKPPLFGPARQFHEDFQILFKSYRENIDDSKRWAEFMAKAVEFQEVANPKTSSFDPATAKVKDLQQFYDKWIPAIKQAGNDLFQDGEAPNLIEVSYDELKAAWEQAEPSFDTLLTVVRSLDPNAPFDASLVQQLQSGQVKEVGDRVSSFDKLLKAAIDNNTASDILALTELSKSSQQLEQKLQELKKRYFIILLPRMDVLAQSPQFPPTYLRVNVQFTEPSIDPSGTDIYVDGKYYGQDPIRDLSPGTHTIKCSKRGYFDYEVTVDFPKEDLVTCTMSKTTLLIINIRDSNGNKLPANVYIDDKFESFSDSVSTLVRKGPHKIGCVQEGYQEFTKLIEVNKYVPPEEGMYQTVECILAPLDKTVSYGFWQRIWISIVSFFKSLF